MSNMWLVCFECGENCKERDGNVSTLLETCPNCGARPKMVYPRKHPRLVGMTEQEFITMARGGGYVF